MSFSPGEGALFEQDGMADCQLSHIVQPPAQDRPFHLQWSGTALLQHGAHQSSHLVGMIPCKGIPDPQQGQQTGKPWRGHPCPVAPLQSVPAFHRQDVAQAAWIAAGAGRNLLGEGKFGDGCRFGRQGQSFSCNAARNRLAERTEMLKAQRFPPDGESRLPNFGGIVREGV